MNETIDKTKIAFWRDQFSAIKWQDEHSATNINRFNFQSELHILRLRLSQTVFSNSERKELISTLKGPSRINAEDMLERYALKD